MSQFVYWRNHRLSYSWRFWWHRPYFIVKFLLSLCILFIHCSFVSSFNWFELFLTLEFFWVLASSLVIVFKLLLIFVQSEPQCSYKMFSNKKKNNAQLITWSFLMIRSVSLSVQYSRFLHIYVFSICVGKKICKELNS